MLAQFFVNICIFITFLFLSGIWSKKYTAIKNSQGYSIWSGVLFGLLGISVMFFAIHANDQTRMDLRHLAPITAAAYVGWIPTIISSFLIGIARMVLFGINQSAVTGSIVIVLTGLICSFISVRKMNRFLKIIIMNFSGLVLIFVGLNINLDSEIIWSIFPFQVGISFIGSLFIYMTAEYIEKSNELFWQLEKSATTDYLTSLNNVRQFDAIYNQEIQKAKEKKEKLSLLLIDIDHFKKVNDTYGHPAGDEVLKQLGTVLVRISRSFDIVSRNGGEEFSVLLLDCPIVHALEIGERIRAAVAAYHFILPDQSTLRITVSIGAATFPGNKEEEGDDIFKEADKALYQAKRNGRNQVCSL
jgi:diguanylate cyclase